MQPSLGHTLPSLGALGLQTPRAPTPEPASSTGGDAAEPLLIDFEDAWMSDPTPTGLSEPPAAAPTPGPAKAERPARTRRHYAARSGLSDTILDVTMHAPAATPQVDVERTAAHLRDVAARRPQSIAVAPLSSHLMLKDGSDCYCMSATLSLGAYDLDGQAVSHNGVDVAPSWMAMALRMGGDARGAKTSTRLRSLYGPMLNALVARLRQTLFSLLSHENLGLHEIEATVDLSDGEGSVAPLVACTHPSQVGVQDETSAAAAACQRSYATLAPSPEAPGMLGDHGAMTITLRIDPLTSRMLRERFAEYDRLKREADAESMMNALQSDEVVLGSGMNDDPIPYGCDDLLWGQTLSELLWLAGAEMRPDLKRRDAAAFRQCLCDAEMLKPPNAPPHFAAEPRVDETTTQRVVQWRIAVAPMALLPC